MHVPVRVTGPAGPVVALGDLKRHLVVSFDDDDPLIEDYEAAAVAMLDGWHGHLGRCILPQVWRQEGIYRDCFRLALPDVTDVTVTRVDGDQTASLPARLLRDPMGIRLAIEGARGAWVTVDYTCSLPEALLPTIRQAVRMLVGHWYEHRSAVVTGTIATRLPLAVEALVGPLRWTRI